MNFILLQDNKGGFTKYLLLKESFILIRPSSQDELEKGDHRALYS